MVGWNSFFRGVISSSNFAAPAGGGPALSSMMSSTGSLVPELSSVSSISTMLFYKKHNKKSGIKHTISHTKEIQIVFKMALIKCKTTTCVPPLNVNQDD